LRIFGEVRTLAEPIAMRFQGSIDNEAIFDDARRRGWIRAVPEVDLG